MTPEELLRSWVSIWTDAHVHLDIDFQTLAAAADELERLRKRDRLLRFYLAKVANKVGRPTTLVLDNVHDIEHVGEGVLAELERRETATVNSELSARPLSWEKPLSVADQAQLDDLRARMEAEQVDGDTTETTTS